MGCGFGVLGSLLQLEVPQSVIYFESKDASQATSDEGASRGVLTSGPLAVL